jgi:hypothetical protein
MQYVFCCNAGILPCLPSGDGTQPITQPLTKTLVSAQTLYVHSILMPGSCSNRIDRCASVSYCQ